MVTGESKLWVGIKDLPTEVQLEMANTTNIITITQIPNNQYGYRVQLLDTDGSPLKDVVIKGIDDPSTEIRTNAEGIVQFYSSKSSFTGLTYEGYPSYLDTSMFPKTMQGYINDTSVVIVNPDVNDYYGYDITVTDQNNTVIPNLELRDSSGILLGTTDNTGHVKRYRPTSTITIKSNKGTNDYYVNNITVNGAKGSLAPVTITVSPYYGTLTLGQIIKYCGKDWILCHIDNKKHYLAIVGMPETTTFGDSNIYAGSTLASRASAYQDSLMNAHNIYATKYLSDVTVNDVTSKVFVASSAQMNGGFSYFNGDDRRIAVYNGAGHGYWTSTTATSIGYVDFIRSDGSLQSAYYGESFGFRPFICLSL